MKPRRQLLPPPSVHPDLAPLAALAMADQDRPSVCIEIALGQSERFADPQTRAPQHDDQATEPDAIRLITGGAHHRDDLLDLGGSAGYRRPLFRGGGPRGKG